MKNITTIALNQDSSFTISIGDLLSRSQSSATVRCGSTMLSISANVGPRLENDDKRAHFMPLQILYCNKMYAARKIPGGFTRREGKSSDAEVLFSRLIDRSIRPFFHGVHFPYDMLQVVVNLFSYDEDIGNLDVLSIYGVCAALRHLGIDIKVGASRVCLVGDEMILNPSNDIQKGAKMNLLVAANKEGAHMIDMFTDKDEAAISKGDFMRATQAGESYVHEIIDHLDSILPGSHSIVQLSGKPVDAIVKQSIVPHLDFLNANYRDPDIVRITTEKIMEETEHADLQVSEVKHMVMIKVKAAVRRALLNGEPRLDGRMNDEIRQIDAEVNAIPSAHGSALFRRGMTHSLAAVTIGAESEAQILDCILGKPRDNFMLHYNFPPYCVGETGAIGSPKRREIGHGNLAKKAIVPSLPANYRKAVRVVSEILSADGSTSMASVCASSLALQNSGVPISNLTAGIAMGIVINSESKKYTVLSDINATEDMMGDIDLKIAGTKDGITAVQMDVDMVSGVNLNLLEVVVDQGLNGIAHILGIMESTIESSPKSSRIPLTAEVKVEIEDIKFIIGKMGSNIKKIINASNTIVDIDDKNGLVRISGESQEQIDLAIKMLKESSGNRSSSFEQAEIGKVYSGTIMKIFPVGAFVNIGLRNDGFLRKSDAPSRFSLLEVGGDIQVKVKSFENGKTQLELAD